jgi:signal transduction histidine kinase
MELETLEEFTRLGASDIKGDWIKYLDTLFTSLRTRFVFDNLAVYKMEKPGGVAEAVYARAVGRGRNKEADAPWGENIANQVIAADKIMASIPLQRERNVADRTALPYLLGLPLELSSGPGALVFVRFGGPEYSADQLPLAMLAASRVVFGFERRALQDARAQLDLAQHRAQLQDDFIATISHELHTPLGFIKGYTTSLLRSDTTWDDSTRREFLNIIDEETDQLIMLISRMLDSARLQSGNMPMDFQPVRLDSLLRDVVMRIQGRHKSLDVVLDVEPAPPIEADIVRLTEVFNNLFDNAIKYALGTRIDISVRVEKAYQVVTFSDHGPGIPAQHLPFLFERFYRVQGGNNQRGAGLGLFICKQIIQAHNGHISVKTVPGKGTSFRIELPAKATPVSPER